MTGNIDKIKQIKTFVLDMDGTIYLGDRLFNFTHAFLSKIQETGRDFCFFTNNSSKNRRDYLEKLAKMGIEIGPEKMLISNGVILDWLWAERPGCSAYVVGTPALLEDFCAAGIEPQSTKPDYVVLGFDTTLTYEKLRLACDYVRNGAELFGVNQDLNCPVEGGFIPDCGSIAQLVRASTGVSCEFFGKPSRYTLDYILKHTGRRPQELAVIGDRLYTDIALADGTEVTSILVMSGETDQTMLSESAIKPDIICEDLSELSKFL